ncbi:hypothetical protein C8Q75DRAFT_892897 [Abortiporus biennis]|nr:hypothetical protein C8Q75DRAFT_892897 [Abortiporus biennis]
MAFIEQLDSFKKLSNVTTLISAEIFWRDHQARNVLDATRISDGTVVVLKHLTGRHFDQQEITINEYFSGKPLANDPRNHCIPLYDVLKVPETDCDYILVYPLLRSGVDPPFTSIGEIGVQFMHHNHVAHRDIMVSNIMMDPRPLFPDSFHPQKPLTKPDGITEVEHFTRTFKPTRYYLIDFSLSRKYKPPDESEPLDIPVYGGDRTIPEFQPPGSCELSNPFRTDIYCLGSMFKIDFMERIRGLDFMKKLVKDMMQYDHSKRPTIDEVAERYDEMRHSLSWWKLRSWAAPVCVSPIQFDTGIELAITYATISRPFLILQMTFVSSIPAFFHSRPP